MAASDYTTTGSLSDSLDEMVASARITREFKGTTIQLVDRITLDEGRGLTWKEITLAKLTATAVSETERLDNPQQITDEKFTITPTVTGVHTILTERVKARISGKAFGKIGGLAQSAMDRKKDTDCIAMFDTFTSLGAAGSANSSGLISAASVRITSNATEPGQPPIRCVLHGYQKHDLHNELVSGVGTYPIGDGPTADVFKRGFMLPISSTEVYEDGNIVIDGSGDAKGAVFAKEAIVLVQGRTPWRKEREEPDIGGGALSVWLYDEYALGERLAAGTTSAWAYEIYSDATTPDS